MTPEALFSANGGRGGGGGQGRGFLWCAVTSSWNRRGHFRGLCGVGWGPLEHFPQVDEVLGTRVSHQQLDVLG